MAATGWQSPIIGVLGGFGPAATVCYLDQLVRRTEASSDQGHIDAIISQHSTTPDRSTAILKPDLAPELVAVLSADAVRLEAAGADLLVSPCNTVHAFWPIIEQAVSISCLSIVTTTVSQALISAEGQPIAVLATEGTLAAGFYQQALKEAGGQTLALPPSLQLDVDRLIYSQAKAGAKIDIDLFEACISSALEAGAKAVILACTELSVIYDRYQLQSRPELIDSLSLLVLATIEATGHKAKSD